MKLDKHDALVLIKAIHSQTDYLSGDEEATPMLELKELQRRLESFVCYGDGSEEQCATREPDDGEEEEEENDEEAADDGEEEEEPSGEDDEADDEDAVAGKDVEEADGDGADEMEEEELEADYTCEPGELHDLEPAPLAEGGRIELEGNEPDMVDVLVDGYSEVLCVRYLRRVGKELHVRPNDGRWRIFTTKRWPKGWSGCLPNGEVVEVGAG